jgi:hypothetical protein
MTDSRLLCGQCGQAGFYGPRTRRDSQHKRVLGDRCVHPTGAGPLHASRGGSPRHGTLPMSRAGCGPPDCPRSPPTPARLSTRGTRGRAGGFRAAARGAPPRPPEARVPVRLITTADFGDRLRFRTPRSRVISDCHFSVQLNHFIPGFLSYSVPGFLK